MATLITISQLSTITQSDPPIESDDPFALETIRLAEEAVLDYLEVDELPAGATARQIRTTRRVALLVAKRFYQNPELIRTEGGIGPIGGDTFSEGHYAGLELTEAEKATLDAVEIPGGSRRDGLRVIRVSASEATLLPNVSLPDAGPGGATDPFVVAGPEDWGAYE